MVETESSGRQRAHRGVSLQMACTSEDRFGSKCEELKTSIKSPLLPSKRTLERTSQLVAFVPQGNIGGAANSSGGMPPSHDQKAHLYIRSGSKSGSNALRTGAEFGFNFTVVQPQSWQSRVVCLIHFRSPSSCLKARRI